MDQPHPPTEPSGTEARPEATTIHRPRSVTLLALGVLILAGLNLVRFVLSLRDWSFLAAQPGVSPYYLAISGFIWAVAGAFLVWGLWKAKNWAPRLMQAVALTYALYYWLDLLLLRDHPVNAASGALRAILPTSWQFSAGVTVVSLAFMLWVLSRSKVKAYFGQLKPGHTLPEDNQMTQGS